MKKRYTIIDLFASTFLTLSIRGAMELLSGQRPPADTWGHVFAGFIIGTAIILISTPFDKDDSK